MNTAMPEHHLVLIAGGRFLMGSQDGQDDERPVHEVVVSSFELASCSVTQAQYASFLEATGHPAPLGWPGTVTEMCLPVTGVSWLDAHAYCGWQAANGAPLRLPTEAEWEYAARGGLVGARYPWGNDIPTWIPNGGRGPIAGPWPVTLGEPNGYGLFGVGANIHEWCADWHSAGYYAESAPTDPAGPSSGSRRVSRGGAWRHSVTISTCAQRSKLDPSFRYTDYGFRVARAT